MKKSKIILSGGGSGGHIYPAVAVAEALERHLAGGVELLFVGAAGEMEMEKIPALGYTIEGLPMAGLQRRFYPRNVQLPFKVVRSLWLARGVIRDFGADVVVGFGGFASAPVLAAARSLGVPTVVQEQNSVAGLTNRMLGRGARAVCCAYEGMERFFPPERIVLTGNPLRSGLGAGAADRTEALNHFGLETDRPVLLVVGGSLGSRTFNDMMKRHVGEIAERGEVQVIWQTGKRYAGEIDAFMAAKFPDRRPRNIWRGAFIDRMDLAYAAADLVVSRSGAITISELSLAGKPVLFVPSPNVAGDHQTCNAMALVERGAAAICHDSEAIERAVPLAVELVRDPGRLQILGENIRALGIADSADRVARIIIDQIPDHNV